MANKVSTIKTPDGNSYDIDAKTLEGKDGAYYLNYNNFTNKPTIPTVPDISGKLDKTTYEWNKEINFGSSGKLYIGSFPMYDSCVTVTIKSTASTTYYGVFVLRTQNVKSTASGSYTATVYGDATNAIAPNILIERPANTNLFNIYFNPQTYSKNLIHIQAVSLNTNTGYGNVAPPTNVCTSVTAIPSGATIKPTNALTDNFLGKTAKASDSDKLDGNDSTYYLNYNNLSNKPTIPTGNVEFCAGTTTTPGMSGSKSAKGVIFDDTYFTIDTTSTSYPFFSLKNASTSNNGLMSSIDKTKLDSIDVDDIKKRGVYYIEGTSTTAGTWTGTCDDITSYYDGLTVAYRTNIAGGSSTTTLNINGLGAKTCYLRATTKVTTHYGVNTVIMFTYITVSGTGRWVTSDYDANSYAYLRQYFETANSELPIIMSHSTSTSGDDSYKTAYGGVVAGVTLNPSTKTISATAFKENGTSLADKYVAKVSGKGLSTNDYTTTEKTKLAGLSNYTLPTATSSVLGGVKIGSNITNSSGTISITSTNVNQALGYVPANILDVENKADVYVIEGTDQTIAKGMDLSGKTIVFDTSATLSTAFLMSYTITFDSGYKIEQASGTTIVNIKNPSGTSIFTPYYNEWMAASYTCPSDMGTVTGVTSTLAAVMMVAGNDERHDCESNYKEIQALKANSGGGGGAIYRHTISFSHSGPYAMDAITVYSSSSEPVGQSSQAFELLGTGWYATYMSSMYGDGMIIAKMTDSTTLSFKGAVSGTDTVMAVYDTVKQV